MRAMSMPCSDAQLLKQWRKGDTAAGEALFERYYDVIERFFVNKAPSYVADLVQETFIACFEARDRITDDSRFRSYLFSIAYNILRRHLRRDHRSGEHIDFEEISVHALTPTPSALVARRREHRLLLEALRSIPLVNQVILELYYWEDLPTDSIAEVLGLPPGTVRGRLCRARDSLEAALGSLTRSHDELASTLTRLEDWARECVRVSTQIGDSASPQGSPVVSEESPTWT